MQAVCTASRDVLRDGMNLLCEREFRRGISALRLSWGGSGGRDSREEGCSTEDPGMAGQAGRCKPVQEAAQSRGQGKSCRHLGASCR